MTRGEVVTPEEIVELEASLRRPFVSGVNERGVVVGGAYSDAGWRPFTWSAAHGAELLPLPPGLGAARGVGIDGQGNVVVSALHGSSTTYVDAFVFRAATRTYEALDGRSAGIEARPLGVSEQGVIVGSLWWYSEGNNRIYEYPGYWGAETLRFHDLPYTPHAEFGGGMIGRAQAMNDAGTIVGSLNAGPYSLAVVWVDRDQLPEHLGLGRAVTINNHGVIGGYEQVPGEQPRAVLWDLPRGRRIYLGGLASGETTTWSVVTDINDDGRAVGQVSAGPIVHAVEFARYAPQD
jgi:hypothetical protein